MNPTNQLPQLTDKQKKQYNTYRATGMPPERALSLSLQEADQKYSPLSTQGLDSVIFGKGGLVNEFAGGIADAVTAKGAREQYEEDVAKFGQEYADQKKPLTYGSKIGKGVGRAAFSLLETADDLTGEAVSGTLAPVLEDAVNSDVGQYLTEKALDFNEEQGGVPGEILELTELFAIPAFFTQPLKRGTAQSIKENVIRNGKRIVDQGIDSARPVARLADYFKPTTTANPIAKQIDEGFKGIEEVLVRSGSQTRGANTAIADQLTEIKAMIRNGSIEEKVLPMLDDFDLTPEDRDLIATYLKNIDEAVNQDGAADVVEAYLTGTLDRLDSAAAGSVSVIERLSDSAIERGVQTVENVRAVPGAIADRVKGANDRRIIRISQSNTDQALENILELYKKGVVPGVKKKNKTITNITQINEAVKRVVPELAKKYDVVDLEDFANVIALEKKAIFRQLDEGLKADEKLLDLTPIVNRLDDLAKSERATFSTPLKNAINRARSELVVETPDGDIVVKQISKTGAQDLIADINQALQPQYRGARTNADDIVDFAVVEDLRKLVDDNVKDLGKGGFKDLKAQYADLKKLEDDVVHRAVFEAQKGQGLAGLSDITSVADLAAGAFSPAFLARSAGGFITKEVTKALNDKNELIRQMFLYGKNVDAPVRKGGAPINPVDDVEQPSTFGGSMKIDESTDIFEKVSDLDLKAKVDPKQPFVVEGTDVNLFGTKVPMNAIEQEIIPQLRLYAQNFLTKSGNRQANPPFAVYRANKRGGAQKEIQFNTRTDHSLEDTIHTFYHETGHAIDDLKTGVTPEMKELLKGGEGTALVMDRAVRVFADSMNKYDLTEADIKTLLRGQSVSIGNGKAIAGKRKLGKYLTQYDEIFAEAYSMYRLNPNQLREIAPKMYEYIDNLVK